jgi:hypothetical protein
VNDPRRWLDAPPVYQAHATRLARIKILREDVIDGGSKMRFLPFLVGDASEVVFGGPFCGGAPYALSVWAREARRRATLFYAARGVLHRRQAAAQRNGAALHFVRPGYMTVVQARARAYADVQGALFLPLGFDIPAAVEPLAEYARRVRADVGQPDQVWCCAGSGMVARVIAAAFPDSQVCAVAVGLASRHEAQDMPGNVRLIPSGVPFERASHAPAPFPSCPNYDLKAWARCAWEAKGSVLFWNVAALPAA